MRPLVLLDIDGVINAWPLPRYADNASVYIWDRFRVFVHDDTVEALRHVFHGAQEVLWCTAWREAANVDPLAWLREQNIWLGPELGVITDGGRIGTWTTDWKLREAVKHPKVREAKAEGRPIVWIEDFGWGTRKSLRLPDITEANVTRAGIRGVDTFTQGYVTRDHLEGTGLITREERLYRG